MRNNNQQRRPNFGAYRIASNLPKTTNFSSQPLISTKQYKRPDRSKQYQNQQKIVNEKSKKKTERKQTYQQYQTSTGSKIRNIKSAKISHTQINVKRHESQRQNPSRVPSSYIQSHPPFHSHSQNNLNNNLNGHHITNGNLYQNQNQNQNHYGQYMPNQAYDSSVHGILISVNIQDLVGPRHVQNIYKYQNRREQLSKIDNKLPADNRQNSANLVSNPQNFVQNNQNARVSRDKTMHNNQIQQNNQICQQNINNQYKKIQRKNSKQSDYCQFQCTQEIIQTRKPSPLPRDKTVSKMDSKQQSQTQIYQKPAQKQKSKQKTPPSSRISPQSLLNPKTTLNCNTNTVHYISQMQGQFQNSQATLQPNIPALILNTASASPFSKEKVQQFANSIPEINNLCFSQSLIYLDNLQSKYRINPKYIEECQPNFTWQMRAYVIEWMMEVSEQFGLKRETFHISVNLLDRYLMRQKGLPKSGFQAIGAASMFIASKLQQFQPKTSQDFAITTGRLISAAKLNQNQRKIFQVLQYKLHPPTLCRWANRLMLQWDTYISSQQCANMSFFQQFNRPYFKQNSQDAYKNYRLLMQLIDCSILDIQTCEYSPKILVCSFMYLYLLSYYKIYPIKQIWSKFPQSSLYLFDDPTSFNIIFSSYLQFTFGFVLQDLLPTIQYCAGFFVIPQNVDAPAYFAKNADHLCQNMLLQEYQSYQSFDRNLMKAVIKRRKMHADVTVGANINY